MIYRILLRGKDPYDNHELPMWDSAEYKKLKEQLTWDEDNQPDIEQIRKLRDKLEAFIIDFYSRSKQETEKCDMRLKTVELLAMDMIELGLKGPFLHNKKARFYFTEYGWDNIGRELASRARQRGYGVKIIRKKQPKRSDVVYHDPYQVAVIESKGKK